MSAWRKQRVRVSCFFCSMLVKKISWQAPKAAEGIREGLAGRAAAAARRAEGCGVTAQSPVAFIPRWCPPAFVLVPSSQAHHGAPRLFPEPKASQKSPRPSCPALGSRWLIPAPESSSFLPTAPQRRGPNKSLCFMPCTLPGPAKPPCWQL